MLTRTKVICTFPDETQVEISIDDNNDAGPVLQLRQDEHVIWVPLSESVVFSKELTEYLEAEE